VADLGPARRRPAEARGEAFGVGVVLDDGDAVVPFAGNLAAAALSCLWH
jgi:hypothetical protein